MKCKYLFPVKGDARIPHEIGFSVGQRAYQFEIKDGVISGLSVTLSDFPEHRLPTIAPCHGGKIKASISIPPDPHWNDLVSDIRTIEGALCIWGIHEIDTEHCEIQWLPESEAEKAKLQMYSFNLTRKHFVSENEPPPPVDLFVRSVLAVSDLRECEVPLNFYRRGRLDVFEERYIDAIYDLYFVLETLFADGKYRKKAVIKTFCASEELLNAINQIKKDSDPQIRSDAAMYN